MFGVGRYDGLVGLFGVEPVATVGFAPGLTMMELLRECDLPADFCINHRRLYDRTWRRPKTRTQTCARLAR